MRIQILGMAQQRVVGARIPFMYFRCDAWGDRGDEERKYFSSRSVMLSRRSVTPLCGCVFYLTSGSLSECEYAFSEVIESSRQKYSFVSYHSLQDTTPARL
jgi:hypothetical protein